METILLLLNLTKENKERFQYSHNIILYQKKYQVSLILSLSLGLKYISKVNIGPAGTPEKFTERILFSSYTLSVFSRIEELEEIDDLLGMIF